MIVFNFALSQSLVVTGGAIKYSLYIQTHNLSIEWIFPDMVVYIEKQAAHLASSKNAVLSGHKVGFLLGVLVVVNLHALFTMQVVHLRPALDRVNLVMVHAALGLFGAHVVVHFAPL